MVWWLLLRDRDDEEADAEDGFSAFQGYRRFRSLLRPRRKKNRELSSGSGTQVFKKVQPPWLIAFGILLAAVVLVMVASR